MVDRLAGKVAVITGGASGIGWGVAQRYIEEGARVVIGDRNEALLAERADALGDNGTTCAGDVTSEADLARLVSTAVDTFGRLDIGVNCAGLGTFAPIHEQTEEQWDQVLDINLKGVFFSIKHEARAMLAGGHGGAIINIASINARQPAQGMSAYCASKAGVEMMTRVAAMELGPHGIRVTGIGPGLIDTPLTSMFNMVPGMREEFIENIPAGRTGQPRDIANAALFLASDDAEWVNGDTLFVDGGELTMRYPRMFALLTPPTE
jgi:NAD(P)-dependent dehydrogenase (short-subunit alcohol dehydrogenase family)